jgi:hypothetical protein
MIRLLTTVVTAGLVVWAANHFAETVDSGPWRAPAAAVRDGFAEALRQVASPQKIEDGAPRSAAESQPARVVEVPVQVSGPNPPPALPVEKKIAPLTRSEAEVVRRRLERVMQLARTAGGG